MESCEIRPCRTPSGRLFRVIEPPFRTKSALIARPPLDDRRRPTPAVVAVGDTTDVYRLRCRRRRRVRIVEAAGVGP